MKKQRLPKTHASQDELRQWLATLPSRVDYEREDFSVSRQDFLDRIVSSLGPNAAILVYLQDRDHEGSHFLTLGYAAGLDPNGLKPPRHIRGNENRNSIKLTKGQLASDLSAFSVAKGYGRPLSYVLSEFHHPIPDQLTVLNNDIGLAVAFLPSDLVVDPLMRTQLQMCWRLFSSEIARSRQQRSASAIREMLRAIGDNATLPTLCGIIAKYCRSKIVYLYERHGHAYKILETWQQEPTHIGPDPGSVNTHEVELLLTKEKILRSHVAKATLPTPLRTLADNIAWMLIPCHTSAINILAGNDTRYPQYLIFLTDKENAEYLGEDFSFTDMEVAECLVSLLSNHLPYMTLPVQLSRLLDDLNKPPLADFTLAWFADITLKLLPSLHSVAIFPDFPSDEGASFHPSRFNIRSELLQTSSPRLAHQSCLASDSIKNENLSCLLFNIATEYRDGQRIAFAFSDQYVQNAHMQILNVLVEYIKSVVSVIDFREYLVATQAQIRHVIRGSLSAAISEIELVRERTELYSGMPTKLVNLLHTPTMRDCISDSLSWLIEAYNLADAPRYLLDSFNRGAIRWSDVSPAELVRSILATCRGEMRRRGIRPDFQLSEHCENLIVSADTEFLKIVIFNLIDNAIKYSFQDRRLQVELETVGSKWRLSVENTGVPISKEDRKRIFDPWVRSFRQSYSNRRPGTGLGLAVSNRILRVHDPDVYFDFSSDLISSDPPTARTRFFFELPLKGKG